MARGTHRLRDIAEQAGLSVATVDRVLHGRPHTSRRAARQVEQAVHDLDRQQSQLRLGSRTLMLDVVMHAPERFSSVVRQALEDTVPGLRPSTVRARFHHWERVEPVELVRVLDGLGGRGRRCDGVLLKAPDDQVVAAAVDRLAERGVPVVTLVTDVHGCRRVAYVGLDNVAAGRTAAYLVQQWRGRQHGPVLTTLSRSTFFGEQERHAGFTEELLRLDPGGEVLTLSDTDGLDEGVGGLVRELVAHRREVAAVYCIGGGNRAIDTELRRAGVLPAVHIGHDLDDDNRDLLRSGRLSAVLHHDLRVDVRRACEQVMRHHRLLPGAPTSVPAAVQVVTPHNVPDRLGP